MTHPSTPLAVPGITRYHRPNEAYTKIRNDFARNAKIKLRAFRVASYVLSHQDGFVQTQEQIARACGLSVTTVRAALEDLRADRYLVSRRLREGGRWIGTAYAVSDIPFTDSELAALSAPCAECECSECECSESMPPKKISSSKKINQDEEDQPSGGTPGGAPSLETPPIHEQQEEPVSKPAESLALFDIPAPDSTDEEAQAPSPSAGTVVAAFVDSYRQHHSGGNPLKKDIGRVARESKALLDTGEAGPLELTEAATEMGKGPYANIGMALKILRDRSGRRGNRQAGAPARPHTDADWAQQAQDDDRAWFEELMSDDDAIRWARQDPDEVRMLIRRYGAQLAARFEAVA